MIGRFFAGPDGFALLLIFQGQAIVHPAHADGVSSP